MNCTPSAQQGAHWILFTQTLICNDKINDGAYALGTNFPEGSWANLGKAEAPPAIAWAFLHADLHRLLRALSRALQSRGYIEE